MNDVSKYATVIVALAEDEGGGYLGFVPDLPGCMSDGETREEAINNLADAMQEWVDTQTERNRSIPAPGSAAEEMRRREEALIEALKALEEYRDHADTKIASLERRLTELISILKDDLGQLPRHFEAAAVGSIIRRSRH